MADAHAKTAWHRSLWPEDPRRMVAFRGAIDALDWSSTADLKSLNTLRNALDTLAEAEVRYYYRRRATRAWISGLCRFAAWTLGTLGLLVPLSAATGLSTFREASPYGYLFLTAAGSALAANSLFGGTSGHVRFVTTQLSLERLITTSRLAWASHCAASAASLFPAETMDAGFKLLQAYAEALYDITISETGDWGKSVIADLAHFEKSVKDAAARRHAA